MKNIISSAITASLLLTNAAFAEDVISSGQATTICKNQAVTNHSDFKRSKTRQIKETRNGFELKLKVYLEDSSVIAECDVKRDGTVAYSVSE